MNFFGILTGPDGWAALGIGLAAAAALAFVTWIVSVARHDVSLVDRVWSLCILAASLAYALVLPTLSVRSPWMLLLLALWAGRLSLYITWRNWGHPEDRRYQEIRARNQPNFAFKSLYLVFALQAVLACIVSTPLLAGLSGPNGWGLLDSVGALIGAAGLLMEATADWQMARFKSRAENKGRVMDRGVWRYSRHPNYFGECCVWWGLYLMALAGGAGAWSIVSPLLMTFLLLKVSGVTLLEKDMSERRPAYRDYIARTPAFVPGLPRKD